MWPKYDEISAILSIGADQSGYGEPEEYDKGEDIELSAEDFFWILQSNLILWPEYQRLLTHRTSAFTELSGYERNTPKMCLLQRERFSYEKNCALWTFGLWYSL